MPNTMAAVVKKGPGAPPCPFCPMLDGSWSLKSQEAGSIPDRPNTTHDLSVNKFPDRSQFVYRNVENDKTAVFFYWGSSGALYPR